jgi:type IV pilus assembly protein PilE
MLCCLRMVVSRVVLRAPRRSRAAFTLVELMATVAIVGILAVVAYAGYHRFVVSSHQAEANAMLSGIKNRQEAYKAEVGTYLDVSSSIAYGNPSSHGFGSLYPHCAASVSAPGAFSVSWGQAACPSACCNVATEKADWLKLKVESSSPTFYGYTTIAGCPTCVLNSTPASAVGGLKIGAAAPTWPSSVVGPWFVATAVGDADGNGVFSTVMIESFDNEVYVDNDGE